VTNPLRGGEPLWKASEATEAIDPFTPAELRKILAAARVVNRDFAVAVQIMMQAGLRPGELLGLRGCDIDRTTGMVSVNGTFSRGAYGPPKNRSSLRKVSVYYPVTEDVAAWRPGAAGVATREVLMMPLSVQNIDPEARLFTWDDSSFSKLWHRVLTKAGVRYRKPHACRHSFASILLSRGANLLAVQRAGGWKSATVMLSTYAKWIEDASHALHTASSG
jgi:integrase